MLKTRASHLILWLGLLIGFKVAHAQTDINFIALTAKEGLPSNTVNAIIKDRHGLMWFGTSNGLSKFDGSNFTVYRHEVGNENSLSTNEVVALYEDKQGRLWVGSSGGGISYYDRKTDRFVTLKPSHPSQKVQNISARSFYEDDKGNLWIGTYGNLFIVNLKTFQISSKRIRNKKVDEPGSFVVLAIFEDSLHRLWLGTNQGLFLYNRNADKFEVFLHNNADAYSISDNAIKTITEDTNGNLWFGTQNGLNKWLSYGKFKVYSAEGNSNRSIRNNVIFAVCSDSYGKLWVGTENGVDIYNPATDVFEHYVNDPRDKFSMLSNSTRAIYIDPAGIYWVGTYRGGVVKYDKILALFDHKLSNPFDPQGLNAPIVNSFAEYKDGKVFIGTDGGGLSLFDKKTRLFKRFILQSKVTGKPANVVLCLHMDHLGKLWVGTYTDGLFQLDPATGSYRQFIADGTANSISSNDVSTVMQDGKGKIWIGTIGAGVSIYDPATNKFNQFNKNGPTAFSPVSPLNDFINTIAKGPNGDIWIASNGTGIAVYHPADRSVIIYDKLKNNLSDDIVQSVLIAKDHTAWVGTNQGLSYLDNKTRKFITYTEKNGLANASIKAIVEDDRGILWLSTDQGISSFDRKQKKFRNFNSENGVQQASFLRSSGLRTSHGDIYFGGEEGFNFFNPAQLPDVVLPNRVLLTDLKVNNVTIVPGEKSPLKEQIATSKEIRLKYGQNFSIGYVALDYTAPMQNQYAYKLEGFDDDWNLVNRNRVANYTNIDPGTYLFKVKTNNTNKDEDAAVTTIEIIVSPPFWRSTFAYILYAASIAGGLFYIRRRGIRKLKLQFAREQEELRVEQLIESERREAARVHELDREKIQFLTNLSHEFRTPISLIAAPVEKLIGQKLSNDINEDLGVINRNIRRLLNLVNQLLDFRKMEEHQLKLDLKADDVVAFIHDTADSFRDIAARKNISLEIKSSRPNWHAFFDHDKLERIIFNLLSNAFKFTLSGGSVSIITDVNENAITPYITITVADTGVGVPEADLDNIFNRFYQSQQPSYILNQGTGIGLSIIKEFVELQDGTITAKLLPERGMQFIVELPLEPIQEVTEQITTVYQEMVEADPFDEPVDDTAINTDQTTKVLLVEDNDEFRQYLAGHLSKYYQIIEAANGKEGWQKALSTHPQLVVSDISMPEMNGVELSKKLKGDKRTRHIPVILLTAIIGEEEQLKGLNAGANDYLTKPFNFQILHARISNLLELNKSLKDTYSKQIHMVAEQPAETESADVKLLNSLMAFMESRMSDSNLSVEDLSKHAGMSRGSLYYKLIELTGLTPIEYMRSVKLEKAAALLTSSDYNVAQIAYMTGFGTPSYFSRMFKGKYGVLPSEYLNDKRGKQ
ncbi:two-component regulator propeller domain-containing protein [Mucilaginibacter auburnensis]|uniref:histidine kinase n=1 Tax=Mucilaginibacter auburnensis TaxID=1457233 RepID=A0A2H9VU26_9SPHI|nr:two-component regulator propeller domain-containing protein [Mucilaginibacter auburnensis]PJJ84315.1 ligand-binding sensor domain-containing protein [Mucilaginibacter auburnensis]